MSQSWHKPSPWVPQQFPPTPLGMLPSARKGTVCRRVGSAPLGPAAPMGLALVHVPRTTVLTPASSGCVPSAQPLSLISAPTSQGVGKSPFLVSGLLHPQLITTTQHTGSCLLKGPKHSATGQGTPGPQTSKLQKAQPHGFLRFRWPGFPGAWLGFRGLPAGPCVSWLL